MSEELKRNFMQQLREKMNPNAVPVSRSYVVRAKPYIENENIEGDNISEEPNWNGYIQLSLFLLVGESKELSPELFEGLPVIDFESLQSYCKEFRSGLWDTGSLAAEFESLLDNIKKANAAASRAFAYVKAELANKEVKIQFGIEFECMTHDNIMPTPAYFVIHLGDSYKITADTPHKEFIKKYCEWLQKNFTSS